MTAALYVVTALFTLVWLGLLFRALFADRSRGRRRCPKCFYEIDHKSGLKCSECGTTAKHERALAKTHRHWGRAVLLSILVLAPALLTAGVARVKQGGGWSDLPSAVMTRLLWIENSGLHDEVIFRIGRGKLSPQHAELAVLAACEMLNSQSADRQLRGFAILKKLGRNSYVLTNDRPNTLRPMLEELRPDVSVPLLLAMANGENPNDVLQVVEILQHLRDSDVEVVLTLLRLTTHEDGAIASGAIEALGRGWRAGEIVQRLPFSPHTNHRWSRLLLVHTAEAVVASFAKEVFAQEGDNDAILEWAIPIARGEDTSGEALTMETDLTCRRTMAIWLACKVDGYSERTWPLVELAAAEESLALQEAAIQQVFGFPWSPEVESLLRRGLASLDTASSAQSVAARYGTEASSLLPDIMASITRVDRTTSSSATGEYFEIIGGDPVELHHAILDRLELVLKTDSDSMIGGLTYSGSATPIHTAMDFGWLADIGLKDERTAELMLEIMRVKKGSRLELEAAIVYASASGDKALATKTILSRDPDLSKVLFTDSPQYSLWNLIGRDLSDNDLIVAHYVDSDDADRRAAFASLFAKYSYRDVVQKFEAALRRLEADPDPSTAASATKALGALDK